MQVSKIIHKGEERIKLDFPRDKNVEQKLKSIPGFRWSKTLAAWHIPYAKETFKKLKALYPQLEIEKPALPLKTIVEKKEDISLEVVGKKIILRLPKNENDIKFICSIRYSQWNKHSFYWTIPNYQSNLQMLKNYFGNRISSIIEHESVSIQVSSEKRIINKNEVLIIKSLSGRLKIIFNYSAALQKIIYEIPYHIWDSKNKWFSIPYSSYYLDKIKNAIAEIGLKMIYEEELEKSTIKPRITKFDIANFRTCPKEYEEKLKELRYSPNTIKTYINAFQEFINYHNILNIDEINEEQIIDFLRYLVNDRKVSSSYQNQSINAIKFYYERVLGGTRQFYYIERPIREKALPTVLSMEEVAEILKNTRNLKHKAMLMICYSAGLRVSELINLKISDIDSTRKQIKVRQSKGKKDRYTLLSNNALQVLREYFKVYKPKDWLFEGQNEQYSVRSIQEVLKESVGKTNINKKVTMHTLRHSFATHLLENGTDIRYIQSLLGHANSKTTEIYTHITTKGFDQIRSPLDSLDI